MLNLKCSNCGSSNTYVTEKEIVCRKCGSKKRKYNSHTEQSADITKFKGESKK
jgi:transcription initiation factor TFIIIB Brf1 subunit/transcription initiation factor TFIIB